MTTVPQTPADRGSYAAEGTTQETVMQPARAADGAAPIPSAWRTYPSLRIAAAILCLAIAALVIWLAFLRSSGSEIATPGGGPVGASAQDLATLSQRMAQPIYWAGTRTGAHLEATVTTSRYVYVRYLTQGAPVGDASPRFLTIATYPAADALGNLRSYASHEHAKMRHIPGGIAVPVPGASTSVYFATRGSDYQVEVYDQTDGTALHLIRSGQVAPVPGGVNPAAPPPG